MADIGKTNKLIILKQLDHGLYLDGGETGEILLPRRYEPARYEIGDEIEVFLYLDSEDRVIATTETPLAEVGQCALLDVIEIGKFGVFLDWGLPKDLLAPFKEQRVPMEPGRSYVVHLFIDSSGRIAASSKLNRHLEQVSDGRFERGQKVSLMVSARSDLGWQAVIDGTHLGLIHAGDVFQKLRVGDRLDGYVKLIRPDGRIDVMLQKNDEDSRAALADFILADLEAEGGRTRLTDASSPAEISARFGVSKAAYKRSLGLLLKQGRVRIDDGSLVMA